MKDIIENIVMENFESIEFNRSFEFYLPGKNQVGLNIRIPFCSNQCDFCLYGDSRVDPETIDRFIDAVLREIDLYIEGLGNPDIGTVYFIAGTPTQIPEQLARIKKHLEREHGFSGEMLTEAHPKDLDRETLDLLNELGIEKIKIGVQSFNNEVLREAGRDHDSETAIEAVNRTLDHRFKHVNIDLMYGLPGQSIEDIEKTLDIAIEQDVPSITTFPLMLLQNSRLYSRVDEEETQLPNNEEEMYRAIREKLTKNGYSMVTLWSYSKQPEEYRGEYMHNNEFIGIGPGNWSYLDSSFYLNTANLQDYIETTQEGLPISVGTKFREEDKKKLWFIRNLYFTEINKKEFRETYGTDIEKEIPDLLEMLKTLDLIKETEAKDGYKLTNQGLDIASHGTKKIVMTLLKKFQQNHLVGAKPRAIKTKE